ncbi:proline-rich transmembrane protein 4-like [Anguilla rostrata]|uniref:proline-rich transmembrane protein 4-like n=1 Tax=Anguilla rostrata TaxID=7938 RepID=UPI0030CC0F8A
MARQGWVLTLCLWHSVLSGLCGALLTGVVTATPPTATGPGDGARLTEGRRAGSSWPFWPLDLWSSGARSRGNAEGETADTASNQSGLAEKLGAPLDPEIGLTWKESFTPTRTGMVARLTTSDPPTPTATATPNGEAAGKRHPHAPWVTVSASGEDALPPTPARPTETPAVVTATRDGYPPSPASGTERGETGGPARADDGSSPASPAPVATPAAGPASAVERAAEEAAGAEPNTDAGSPESGTRTAGQETEEGATAGRGWGDFEDVAWPTQTTPPVSAPQPAGTSPELGGEDDPEVEEPIRRWTASVSSVTPLGPLFADPLPDEDWSPDAAPDDDDDDDSPPPPPPDCDPDAAEGPCNASGPWGPAFPDDDGDDDDNAAANRSRDPFLLAAPPMFVPLHSDWSSAMATWGAAWEAHVYGLGAVFALVAAAAALSLLCLPVRCPSGCGYFALVDLFLLAACCSRAFSLFYDAYSRQDKLPASGTLLLYELPFPCLTAAFGIVFLLLSMRSRMQLSNSVFQHPCFLAALVLLHFGATLGSVVLLQVFTRLPGLFFVSQGSFVALAAFLSAAYLAFYCYVRADAKHIYHLNNTSPPADRYHRCPFADPKDWNRAAVTAVFAALFALACAALQLYAMLHALGLGGVGVFRPWPWWAFHLSCRVCEAGVCLTLALVVAPPLCCSSSSSSSGGLPQPGLCWPRLSWARGRVDLKSPVLPGSYQWSLSQQEKLVICDAIARRESECLPLYALVDTRLSSLDGLDLLYHSGRLSLGTVADDDHDDHRDAGSRKPSLDSDSTGDLRPPSPINLRRSIDEALFGEALFPRGLFGPSRLRGSSELSLDARGPADCRPFGESPADRGLYRTSSCVEMERPLEEEEEPHVSGHARLGGASGSGSDSDSSSAERWGGGGGSSGGSGSLLRSSLDGSSLVLCSAPEGRGRGDGPSSSSSSAHPSQGGLGRYRALGSASRESLGARGERDLAVQAEFISVCRQMDALSVCSDTIDL